MLAIKAVAEKESAERKSSAAAEKSASPGSVSVSPFPLLQRKSTCACGGGCPNCEKASDFTSHLGTGRPLDTASWRYFEPRFGTDLSHVRIHTDSTAERSTHSVNARAYTVGNNIVFGAGQFSLTNDQGKRLMAHELAHVIQQTTPAGTGSAGLAMTRFATPVLARTVDDWLGRTPNIGQMTYTQLLGVIDELNQYLQRQTSSSTDTARIEEALTLLRAEVGQREAASCNASLELLGSRIRQGINLPASSSLSDGGADF